MPSLPAPLPKPRIVKLVCPTELNCWTFSDGTTDCRSIRSTMRAFSIVSAVVTDTDTGTSCSDASRFVAVTVMRSRLSVGSTGAAAAGAATGAVGPVDDAGGDPVPTAGG